MNILNLQPLLTTKDGEGIRYAIFAAGCSHHCYNCQNNYSWDPNVGYKLTYTLWQNILAKYIKRQNMIDGVTFSGGDPLYTSNRQTVKHMIKDIRYNCPNLTIWLYTGYTWDEILKDKTMLDVAVLTDVIVDGEYKDGLFDGRLKYRGSINQRIIDVQKSLKTETVVELNYE